MVGMVTQGAPCGDGGPGAPAAEGALGYHLTPRWGSIGTSGILPLLKCPNFRPSPVLQAGGEGANPHFQGLP